MQRSASAALKSLPWEPARRLAAAHSHAREGLSEARGPGFWAGAAQGAGERAGLFAPMAWEPLYAADVALKKKKKKESMLTIMV